MQRFRSSGGLPFLRGCSTMGDGSLPPRESAEAEPWTPSTPNGRWCGFGPYYAMFPVEFVRRAVGRFCPPGGTIIDPFCGRGTVPFVAQVSGRRGLGVDINPVAWIFASVKVSPHRAVRGLLRRIEELLDAVEVHDRSPENEFQSHAWSADVLGFLNSARRNLDWRTNKLDRTLMAILLTHLHAKRGEGLSNQLRQSKAMAPEYSVRWWRSKGMEPPKLCVRTFLEKKLAWRYAKGIPSASSPAQVYMGDARKVLPGVRNFCADLILTSPPYCGVTNYSYDNWIRLWLLGGPSLPDQGHASRYQNREQYASLISEVLERTRRVAADNVTVYVRTDAREYSTGVAVAALRRLWPDHALMCRFDKAPGATQTALYGHDWHKAGEIDLLATAPRLGVPEGFKVLRAA